MKVWITDEESIRIFLKKVGELTAKWPDQKIEAKLPTEAYLKIQQGELGQAYFIVCAFLTTKREGAESLTNQIAFWAMHEAAPGGQMVLKPGETSPKASGAKEGRPSGTPPFVSPSNQTTLSSETRNPFRKCRRRVVEPFVRRGMCSTTGLLHFPSMPEMRR